MEIPGVITIGPSTAPVIVVFASDKRVAEIPNYRGVDLLGRIIDDFPRYVQYLGDCH